MLNHTSMMLITFTLIFASSFRIILTAESSSFDQNVVGQVAGGRVNQREQKSKQKLSVDEYHLNNNGAADKSISETEQLFETNNDLFEVDKVGNLENLNQNPELKIQQGYSLAGEGDGKISEKSSEVLGADPVLQLQAREKRSLTDDYSTGCGVSKGCFRNENNLFTYVMMTSQDGVQYLNIQLQAAPGMDWIAIGFGLSTNMGEASVVECVRDVNSNNIIAQNSFNDAIYNNIVIDSRGLNVTESGYVDGVLKCSVLRPAVYDGSMADPRLYNLTQPYYLLLACGLVSPTAGVKLEHPFPPPTSSPLTNLSAYSADLSSEETFCHACALQAHGCLMIVGWVFLTGVGILLPRYFKPLFGDRKFFSTPFWFFMHRGLLLLNLFATAAGFIVVFVETNGQYSSYQSTDPTYFYAHAPLGIIVMILVVLNPVMSIFRCAPTDPKRPLFNWFHLAVGMLAQILAVIDIIFGLEIAEAFGIINGVSFWLMIAFTGFHLIIELLLMTFKLCSSFKARQHKTEDINMGAEKIDLSKKESKIHEIFSNILLAFYVIVVLGLTVAMLYFVGS